MDLRSSHHPSPSLSEQTPGLDRVKSPRTRGVLGVLGGLVLIGVGAILALRRRSQPRG